MEMLMNHNRVDIIVGIYFPFWLVKSEIQSHVRYTIHYRQTFFFEEFPDMIGLLIQEYRRALKDSKKNHYIHHENKHVEQTNFRLIE